MARRGDNLDTRWSRPAHTKAKHDILVRYLQAWFPIMGRSQRRAIMLDGFAGPGRYSEDEPGSPLLVLEALLKHRDFHRWACEFVLVFNELDEDRHASLTEVLDELRADVEPWPSNVTLLPPENKTFGELSADMLASLKGANMAPLFAFIDPFGYKDLSLDLIAELVSFDKCELFLYLDFNSINRFATAGNVDEHFDRLFGTDEYRNAPPSGPERQQFLHDLFETQLRAVCNFGYTRSFAMVNDRGHIGNYMFFCTRNLNAFDKMKEAMWKLSPSGEYRFEDRLANQPVLFNEEADTTPLMDDLASHFAGRTVSIDAVVQHVIASTPYYSSQVKVKTLKPMQEAGQITSPNQRKNGTYPAGTLIAFP